MGLDWITIKGFRSISAIEKLHLSSLNVLIGANGSGKSNFISAFSFLHAVREGRLDRYVATAGGADRILHFGSDHTSEMSFHLSFENEVNLYRIKLTPTEDDTLVPFEEVAYYWDKAYPQPYNWALSGKQGEAGISLKDDRRVVKYVQGHLDRWRVYHFHDTGSASPLKKSASLNDNRFLRPDGSNLPAFLFYLKEKHPGSYSLIRSSVKRVAPFFEDFSLQPSLLNPDVIRLEWKHVGSDDYFDVSSFSDGTIRFIALATLFLQPSSLRPSVILVDEPELGLHPYAITMLAAMAKSASLNSQIILSTQSSFLLDNFEPADVLVADRVNGGTVFNRLDSEGLTQWLERYSLGQLWEKGDLAGRPSPETQL